MPLNASALEIGSPGFQTLIQTNRQFIEAIWGSLSCVLREGDFQVTPNATSHAVDVAGGFAALAGRNSGDQGNYFAWSETAETVPWPVPSSNPRIDSLILRIADPQYGTVTGTVGARWDIVQGVPTTTPAARSNTELDTTFFVPGSWHRIADIRINASDSGVIPGGQITQRAVPRKSNVVDYENDDGVYLINSGPTTTVFDSLSPQTAGSAATTTFIAPVSGEVILTYGATLYVYSNASPAVNGTFITPFLSGGHFGSTLTEFGEGWYAVQRFNGTGFNNQGGMVSKRKRLNGLTPGSRYTVTLGYGMNATGPQIFMDQRSIMVEPVLL